MSQDQVNALTESLESLGPLGADGLPGAWKDDPVYPERGIQQYLSDWHRYQAKYESLGIPCDRITSEGSGTTTMQSLGWASPQAAAFEKLRGELDTAFVALARNVAADGPKDENVVLVQTAQEIIVVRREEAAALEAEGWGV